MFNEIKWGTATVALFDHALYSPGELDLEVIRLAMDYGYTLRPDDAPVVAAFEEAEYDFDDLQREHDEQMLAEIADDAVDWLNENLAADGMVFFHDDELGAFLYVPVDPGDHGDHGDDPAEKGRE